MESIPNDKLPEGFKDKDRLNVLYSPIRSESTNISDFDNKVAAWTELINVYCSSNKVYKISEEYLKSTFRFNGKTPSCIKEVIQEMLKNKELEDFDIFLKETPNTWSGWFADKAKAPIWILKQKLFENKLKSYILLHALKKDAEEIFIKLSENYQNKTVSLAEIFENEDLKNRDKENYKLIFHYLWKNNKIVLANLNGKNITECHHDDVLVRFSLNPITQMDISLNALKQNERTLINNVKELEEKIFKSVEEAKNYLANNQKHLAKNCLRRKHELEKKITKKMNALWNVQCLIETLADSQMDSKIWKSFEEAHNTYNTHDKNIIYEIDDTMIKLGEMLDIQSDINSSITAPLVEVNEELLEQELDDLLKEDSVSNKNDSVSEQMENLDLNLPDVPTDNISINENISICSQPQ